MNIASAPLSNRTFSDRDGPWLGIALLLVGVALLGLWQTPQRIHQDCAMCLLQAELLLDGGVPCCDFVDTNPPLIAYLNVPPALLAHVLEISPIVAFHGSVIFLLLISAIEIHILLRKRQSGLRPKERGLVLLTWMALYFAVDWCGNVGQREHLFVLLYVPYLLLRVLRHRGGSAADWFAVLLGVQAGLGASLKPHFLVAAVAVEGVLVLTTRRWRSLVRPENVALAAVVAAYLAHWLFVPAAMREAFFGRWVPMICRGYHAYDATCHDMLKDMLASPLLVAGLVGVLAAAALRARTGTHLRHYFVALATLGAMGLLLVFVQHKGWGYQRIPCETAGALCLALLGSRMLDRGGIFVSARWCLPLVILFGVLLAAWFIGRKDSADIEPPDYLALRRIVERRTQPGDRVLVVATSVAPSSPMLLKTGRWPGSRYLHCFPIAMLYADVVPTADHPMYRRAAEAPAEELRFLSELQEDVRKKKPRLLIIRDGPGWYRPAQGLQHIRVSQLLRLDQGSVGAVSRTARAGGLEGLRAVVIAITGPIPAIDPLSWADYSKGGR